MKFKSNGQTVSYTLYILCSKRVCSKLVNGGLLDFEIVVDQQTRARDHTFEGDPDSGCTPVPAGQPRPYLVNFCPNFAKSP